MANLTPPNAFCGPLQSGLVLVSMTAKSSASAFNQKQIIGSAPISEFWQAEIVLPSRKDGEWRDTSAFLMQLRGGANKCRLYDPHRPLRGAGGLASTVNIDAAAVAGATSITLKNMVASQAASLRSDDMFGIGENLYVVMNTAASDVDGKTTVSFLPPLRKAVAEDDAVNLNKPTGLFTLTSGLDGLSSSHSGFSSQLTLKFFEDPDFD